MLLQKYITSFVLFTALTKTYVWWAALIHSSVALITIVFFILTLILLLLSIKTNRYFSKKMVRPFIAFFVVAPFFVSVITLYVDFRTLLLQLFYVLTFLLSYQSYMKYGMEFVFKLILVSFIFTVITGLYSIISPSYFMQFAFLTDSKLVYWGRAFGFYLQPNSFAISLNLMFIGLILSSPRISYIFYIAGLTFLALLAAASRSNIAGFSMILFFFLVLIVKKYKYKFVKHIILISILSIVFLSFFGIKIVNEIENNSNYRGLYDRLEFILLQDDRSSLNNIIEDQSMKDRIEYQKKYIEAIKESPLYGYGFGVQEDLIKKSVIIDSAHNTVLEILLQGGLLYLLVFLYFCFILIKNLFYYKHKLHSDDRIVLSYKLFLLFMFFYFIFSTTFFSERVVFVIIGIISAALHKKEQLLKARWDTTR